MVSLDQVHKQTNKSSWARLAASASRTSRGEACWVCELEDCRLQESQEHRIPLWLWPTLWWSKSFYLQIFPLFVFLGQCCLLPDVGTASPRTMGFKWPYALLEHGFLSVSFVPTSHLDMEADSSLSSLQFYGKKKEIKHSTGIISWVICTCPFCQGMCCASTMNCWECKVAMKHDVLVLTSSLPLKDL